MGTQLSAGDEDCIRSVLSTASSHLVENSNALSRSGKPARCQGVSGITQHMLRSALTMRLNIARRPSNASSAGSCVTTRPLVHLVRLVRATTRPLHVYGRALLEEQLKGLRILLQQPGLPSKSLERNATCTISITALTLSGT